MTSYPTLEMIPQLSGGSLERIITNNCLNERPIVQIMATRVVPSGSIRCNLWDGIKLIKTAVIKQSQENSDKYKDNHFNRYSVVRLNNYSVITVNESDVQVLIIAELDTIVKGCHLNKKLEINCDAINTTKDTIEGVIQTNDRPMNPVIDMSVSNGFTETNANYRPRTLTNTCNDTNSTIKVVSIDKSKVCPINAITPFFNNFVIRVRISSKTPIRKYKGKDGRDGKLFSFDATDDSSEIRITAFNVECDKYYDMIEKDLIYLIYRGNVKSANKKFSNLKSDYEITLNSDSVIEVCEELFDTIPLRFNFIPIGQLVTLNIGASVDIIGIIRSIDDIQTITSKKNTKEYKKRDVCLVDKTLSEVRLTLWEKEAEELSAIVGQVLAVKNAVIGEFRGKTLSCVQNSVIELDPDINEAHILLGWYDNIGGVINVTPLSKVKEDITSKSDIKYLCQINETSISNTSVLYYNCKATILTTNRWDKHLYKSCGLNGCLKKVREENNFYYCDKCGNNSSQFQWRLMISLCCFDCTGELWITVFQEVAEKIIGKSITELSAVFESDPNQYQLAISSLNFKTFIFRIGSKVEEYNQEKRVKSTCISVKPIDPINQSKQLIQNITLMNNQTDH
ncbi:replication protein A 70 kDa DNA-binding subunit-like [Oppia nitens]|uniref:replication protein A 70 kDa DNA-binding subunit-like n=1 Tax=Oppia nitens TaxID=1686743 RepID=UPI0023DB858E|nr:replication protein A 70 kDa DNA-binding subunit-like [Oppia nitens]